MDVTEKIPSFAASLFILFSTVTGVVDPPEPTALKLSCYRVGTIWHFKIYAEVEVSIKGRIHNPISRRSQRFHCCRRDDSTTAPSIARPAPAPESHILLFRPPQDVAPASGGGTPPRSRYSSSRTKGVSVLVRIRCVIVFILKISSPFSRPSVS